MAIHILFESSSTGCGRFYASLRNPGRRFVATTRSLVQDPGDTTSIADTSSTFQASRPSDFAAFGADNFGFPDAINLLAPTSARATALASAAPSLTPGDIMTINDNGASA